MRNILFLSTNGETLTGFEETLGRIDASITGAHSPEGAKEELLTHRYQVLVCRCESLDDSQLDLLEFMKKEQIAADTVLVPSSGSVEEAVRAMRMGARDVIVRKTIDAGLIEEVLKGAGSTASAQPSEGQEPVALIGNNKAISEVRTAIGLVAKSQAAVLITGESGTGKEIVARSIHQQSPRRDQPFIAINSAAFPKDVIENELFGHERGAFTGALVKKQGAFELAHRGTLFFDEIAEMSADVQAKLLRAIEQKVFRRLGGKDELEVDVKIIAATNKNIPSALASGELREDLYYRFSVIEIALPPLRERPEDIPLLAEYFLESFAGKYGRARQRFSEGAMAKLCAFSWPGNVRELRNIIERAVVTCSEPVIDADRLPSRVSGSEEPGNVVSIPIGSTFEEVERTVMLKTLASVHNNKSKAARILGLSRKTLHNKLRQYANSGA